MTEFANSLFARAAAIAALYPMPTIKEAVSLARGLNVMIRRDYGADGSAEGFQVYRVGYPEAALYAECPAESLFLAECLAHDHDSARLSLSGRPTLRSVAAVLACRAGMAAGVELTGEVATEDGRPVFYFRNAEHGVEYRATPDTQEPLADIGAAAACAAESAAQDVAARIMAEPEEAPRARSLSAAATPAHMAAGYPDDSSIRAAAMRASLPALRAVSRALAARASHDAQAARRLSIVGHVVQLKAGAIPGHVADAFALRVAAPEAPCVMIGA